MCFYQIWHAHTKEKGPQSTYNFFILKKNACVRACVRAYLDGVGAGEDSVEGGLHIGGGEGGTRDDVLQEGLVIAWGIVLCVVVGECEIEGGGWSINDWMRRLIGPPPLPDRSNQSIPSCLLPLLINLP
jgi:hypothetical protein